VLSWSVTVTGSRGAARTASWLISSWRIWGHGRSHRPRCVLMAYDLLNFLRFLAVRNARLADVVATDLFDYLDWQQQPAATAGRTVVRLAAARGAMPATMNRRVAAVRGLFEFAVMTGARADHPVPAARRSSGLRASRRGLLGHIGPGRPRAGGRLVRQPKRLPESLEPDDVTAFLMNLPTFRDRAITLAMMLGGLRAAEIRSLRLADVDMGMRPAGDREGR